MSTASGDYPESVSIIYNRGRNSIRVDTLDVSGGDGMAKADMVLRLSREALAHWPALAYSDQIKTFVEQKCKKTE